MSYIFMMPQRCHSRSRSKVAVTWRARVSPVTLDLTPATHQKQWSHAVDQVTRVKLSELVGTTTVQVGQVVPIDGLRQTSEYIVLVGTVDISDNIGAVEIWSN